MRRICNSSEAEANSTVALSSDLVTANSSRRYALERFYNPLPKMLTVSKEDVPEGRNELEASTKKRAQKDPVYLEGRPRSLARSMRGLAISVHVSVAESQFPSTPRKIRKVLDALPGR